MTKEEFKARWESYEKGKGNGITFDDLAELYVEWGLGSCPRTQPLFDVRYQVLKAAGTVDAEEYNPDKYEIEY